MVDGRFEGKTVIVTGGSRGIGLATAGAFARERAQVVITSQDEARGQAALRGLREAGGAVEFVRADLTRQADVERMVGACWSSSARSTCWSPTRARTKSALHRGERGPVTACPA